MSFCMSLKTHAEILGQEASRIGINTSSLSKKSLFLHLGRSVVVFLPIHTWYRMRTGPQSKYSQHRLQKHRLQWQSATVSAFWSRKGPSCTENHWVLWQSATITLLTIPITVTVTDVDCMLKSNCWTNWREKSRLIWSGWGSGGALFCGRSSIVLIAEWTPQKHFGGNESTSI